MRVGLVAPVWCSVPPVGYGGTEQVLDALARALQELGHEVVLAATGDSTCPVPTRSLLPGPASTIGEQLPELRHVLYAHRQLVDCDVVHDHTLSGPLLGVGRHDGPPVVTTCHGELTGELGALYRALQPDVPVVAISHDQATGSPGLARAVVHHGLVADDFPVGDGGGGLLFLGRMSPEKGAHRAVTVARAAGLPLRLAAKMRQPEEQAYFDRFVRPRLGGGIEYVGEVAGADKLRLLGEARALLMPIRWSEPFGMVMIEALACGTPVLAFPEGAAPEVVDEGTTGYLCRDEAEMARAVGRLDAISRADCRRVVEERFSARRMAQEYLAVYRSLLAEPRPSSQQGGQRVPRAVHQVDAPRQAGDLHRPVRIDLDVEARAAERDAPHAQ